MDSESKEHLCVCVHSLQTISVTMEGESDLLPVRDL